MAKRKQEPAAKGAVRVVNRRARHDFHILETLECGLELLGTEVKSLRAGQAKIDQAFARVAGGQLFLVGASFAAYQHAAAAMQHDPDRQRRLLVHRRQIGALEAHTRQKGNTIVPLALYFKGSWAKCELGLAVGKRTWDKRQSLRDRQAKRDIDREMRRRG
jgi:SsrA-binding protein